MPISAAMLAHLQSSPTTICHLWRIEERPREIQLNWVERVNGLGRGGTFEKNGGTDGTDDAGAASTQTLAGDGYFRFRTDRSGTVYAGLSATNSGASSASIQFCLSVDADGKIRVLESGVEKFVSARAAYNVIGVVSDNLFIKKQSGVISYWLNRTKLYTSALTPGTNLRADCSIATAGAAITKSVFGRLPTVITACNHTRNLVYNAETYLAFPLTPTRIARAEGLSTDNGELTSVFNSQFFTKEDLKRGRWNRARVEMIAVNYADVTMGHARKFLAYTGEHKLGNGIFTTELRSLTDLMSQEIGEVTGALCRCRLLGDERCGLDLTNYMHAATISAVTDDHHFTINLSPAKADDYFANAHMYWETGANQYNYAEIKSNVGNVLTLKPLPSMPVAVGDTVTVFKGCNRTVEICKTFVNADNPSGTNIENMQAEPYIPGLRKALKFPD